MVAIGIDLGTTNSCIAVCLNGRVEIIPDCLGKGTIPSYVAFTAQGRLFGSEAKDQAVINPHNTIFHTKRLIGRRFTDSTVVEDRKHWPFEVLRDSNKPKVLVEYKGFKESFSAENISSMLLHYFKRTAENYLKTSVTDAVITVPAYFSRNQREATRAAARVAGFNVLNIINEPTAAALAYGAGQSYSVGQNVVVFDLGGGTCDVSVLRVEPGTVEVKATKGDTHLGGEDFDQRILDCLLKQFESNYGGAIERNYEAMYRLREACELAKCELSSSATAEIRLDSLSNDTDYYTTITRSQFEQINEQLFRQAMQLVTSALLDADLDVNEIDAVILIGGSCRIPKIQTMLEELFGGRKPYKAMNPDETVAYGAALHAASYDFEQATGLKKMFLRDVTPLTMGIEMADGSMGVLIKRNTPIPVTIKRVFHVSSKHTVLFSVYEGERPIARDNHMMGEFSYQPSSTVSTAEFTFSIDKNGILSVFAKDSATGQSTEVIISGQRDMLTQQDIDNMLLDAERYQEEDRGENARLRALTNLEKNIQIIYEASRTNRNLSDRSFFDIIRKCDVLMQWITSHPDASQSEFDKRNEEVLRLLSRVKPQDSTLT
ncbi:unnamed protein product [Calicophoron daubneyi]|uniref:Heat shock protein 70 n=1 Tax=Calicophoron daubneyi TaxID=300641 RepID=A0AAV2T0T2_CALDB